MIIHNKARCKKCDTVIESKHRHDFVWCECLDEDGRHNGIAVDGGKEYLRRVGKLEDYEELSTNDDGKAELFDTTDGKIADYAKLDPSVELDTPLIIGMDEEPETEMTLEERLNRLSPKDRLIYEQKGVIQTLKDTIAVYEDRKDLIEEYRKAVGQACKLLEKNMIIRDGDVLDTSGGKKEFVKEWTAIPRDSFDLLREILKALGKEEDE